jgi:integrase
MRERGSIQYKADQPYLVVSLRDPATGKRRWKWHKIPSSRPGKAPSKADIARFRTKVYAELDKGDYIESSRLTVSSFIEGHWLPSLEALVRGGNRKASSMAHYKRIVNIYVAPTIGEVPLRAVDAPKLNRLYGELLDHGGKGGRALSRTTVHHVHVAISKMFADAVKWGMLPKNPASVATAPAPNKAKRSVWGPDELSRFRRAIEKDRLSALWVLAMSSGLRRSELAALRWEDVDLDVGRLQVVQARVVVDGKILTGTPKSDASIRSLGLDSGTVTALRAHQEGQRRDAAPTDLVFTTENGEPIHPERLTRMLAAKARKAELPPTTLHGLRHAHLTAMVEAGVPLPVVQARAGHASIATTMDLYVHVREQMDQEAAERTARHMFRQ